MTAAQPVELRVVEGGRECRVAALIRHADPVRAHAEDLLHILGGAAADGHDQVRLQAAAAVLPGVELPVRPGIEVRVREEQEVVHGDRGAGAGREIRQGQLMGKAVVDVEAVGPGHPRDGQAAPQRRESASRGARFLHMQGGRKGKCAKRSRYARRVQGVSVFRKVPGEAQDRAAGVVSQARDILEEAFAVKSDVHAQVPFFAQAGPDRRPDPGTASPAGRARPGRPARWRRRGRAPA